MGQPQNPAERESGTATRSRGRGGGAAAPDHNQIPALEELARGISANRLYQGLAQLLVARRTLVLRAHAAAAATLLHEAQPSNGIDSACAIVARNLNANGFRRGGVGEPPIEPPTVRKWRYQAMQGRPAELKREYDELVEPIMQRGDFRPASLRRSADRLLDQLVEFNRIISAAGDFARTLEAAPRAKSPVSLNRPMDPAIALEAALKATMPLPRGKNARRGKRRSSLS